MHAEQIHERLVAAGMPELVDVKLPPATELRITELVNRGLASPPLPFYRCLWDVQDGLTAAYYHSYNVERIEREVERILTEVYSDAPEDMPETSSGARTQTLTYEYQACIVAMRRCFDYLAGALTLGLGCRHAETSFRDTAKGLKKNSGADPAVIVLIGEKVSKTMEEFPELFRIADSDPIRDQIVHRRSVSAGGFSIYYPKGGPAFIGLVGGAERFPDLFVSQPEPGRLSTLLSERLRRLEDALVDFICLMYANRPDQQIKS